MTESDYMAALGARIADYRQQRRWSQRELAEKVNTASGGAVHLTQNAVSRLELGIRTLPLLEGICVAATLNMTVADLAGVDQKALFAAAGDERWLCPDCGAFVAEVELHDAWHQRTARLEELMAGVDKIELSLRGEHNRLIDRIHQLEHDLSARAEQDEPEEEK